MSRFVAIAAAVALAAAVPVVLSTAAAGAAAPSAAAASTPGGYVPVAPTRIVDTSSGAYGNHKGALGAHKGISPGVDGADGVPSGAAAVVLSLGVSGATRAGVLVASARSATSAPRAAGISFAAGQNVGDLAIVPVTDGKIDIWNNSAGTVQVTADVSGYYVGGSPTAGGGFDVHPVAAARVADTRYGTGGNRQGAVAAGGTFYPQIAGLAGVPQGAAAVAATVTVLAPAKAGTVSVRTAGGSAPPATMQIQAGRQASQLVIVPLSSSGAVAIDNHTGAAVQIAVDVSGYYAGGPAASAYTTQAVEPSTIATQKIGANRATRFTVAGHGGVPRTGATAAVITLRVVKAATYGVLRASSGASPAVVRFSTGSTRSGVVVAPLDSSGQITVGNLSSKANTVAIDVDGYVTGTAVTVPAPSRSHYLRVDSDSQMEQAGTADAAAGSHFVVLDLGAQSNDQTGVVLSATSTKITYERAATLIGEYIGAYAAQTSDPVTIAVATNNSGDFTEFNAAGRGRRWAQLLTALRTQEQATSQVTLVAADDIEAGFDFASTEAQAQIWEDDFMAALPVTPSVPTDLYFIGSADGCPTVFGQPGRTCSRGWTEAQYVQLAGGSGTYAGRLQALPQVYLERQAVQWTNIAATGSGAVATIVGSLTEHAACPSASTSGCGGIESADAAQGFTALYRGLSSVATPSLSYATDLDIID